MTTAALKPQQPDKRPPDGLAKGLVWLSVLSALVAELVLYLEFFFLHFGIAPPPKTLLVAMAVWAVVVVAAPPFGGFWLARGGHPAVAVAIAWLPSTAVWSLLLLGLAMD